MCATSQARRVVVYFQQTTAIAAGDCTRPCYYTKFRVEGFAAGTYNATRYAYGAGECEGNQGGSWTISVGPDGRGDVGSTNKWWVSSTCTDDSVTVGGITERQTIP